MLEAEIINKIYEETKQSYLKAKSHFSLKKEARIAVMDAAISDVIPGYTSKKLKFADFVKDNFAVLFIDMRGSTTRAKRIGAEYTFLSMHAFIPAMLGVIREYDGYVIDIMGDGIMVFFGGRESGIAKVMAVKNAGMCGEGMLQVREEVTNKLLRADSIEPINCGIGIDYGDVIVTKIGINEYFDVKAFGDCINDASHYSNLSNGIKVSKAIRNSWPKGRTGKMCFHGSDSDGYIMSRKK